MEKALCECCRSVRIGKILIKKSEEEDRIQVSAQTASTLITLLEDFFLCTRLCMPKFL